LDLWASNVAGGNPAPILQSSEHVLDAVAAFVTALVVFDWRGTRLPTRDAGLYPVVFQRISEPARIVAAVGKQPNCRWQAAQKSCRASIVAHLAGSHEEANRPSLSIGDGIQFGIHAAFGSADQQTPMIVGPPVLARRLVAVRCALG
jgi:hypothetical protein